jgi:hypothetical protein
LDGVFASTFAASEPVNLARTPVAVFSGSVATTGVTGAGGLEYANSITNRSVSRYSVGASVTSNWNETQGAPAGLTGTLEFIVAA